MVFITVGLLLQETEDACYCTEGERKRQGVKLNGNLCRSAFGARSGQVSRSMQTPIFSLWSLWTVQQRFQTAHGSLIMPQLQKCVCKGSRGRRAERGRFLHKEGQCPGEAQPERTLLRSHAAHLKPCATATLQCVWSCWASPAYKCSHHRLVSTRDVAAALNISFPQRHCKDC